MICYLSLRIAPKIISAKKDTEAIFTGFPILLAKDEDFERISIPIVMGKTVMATIVAIVFNTGN